MWRAWRGRSVTFAALFALGLLGVSALSEFRAVLNRLDAPWYVWFLAPIVLVAALAQKEQEWIPDEKKRAWWARGIVLGAILLAIGIAKWGPHDGTATSPGVAAPQSATRPRR